MKKIVLLASVLTAMTAVGQKKKSDTGAKCPVNHGNPAAAVVKEETAVGTEAKQNKDWWPNQLDLSILRQNSNLSDPMDPNFNYAEAFNWSTRHLKKTFRPC